MMPVMAWNNRVQSPTQHIIGHFGDDFAGHNYDPTNYSVMPPKEDIPVMNYDSAKLAMLIFC